MILQVPLNMLTFLLVAAFACMFVLATPRPTGFSGWVRMVVGRPFIAFFAAIGLYVFLLLMSALLS